jgi:hypothetical protein
MIKLGNGVTHIQLWVSIPDVGRRGTFILGERQGEVKEGMLLDWLMGTGQDPPVFIHNPLPWNQLL